MAKKIGKHQILIDFFKKIDLQMGGSPPNMMNPKIIWAPMCDPVGLLNSLVKTICGVYAPQKFVFA